MMELISAAALVVVLTIILKKSSDLVFWSKWFISYIYISIVRKSTMRTLDLYDDLAEHDPVKVGFISATEEIVLESPLEEDELHTKADEVFCYGVNSKSESLIVRVARSCDHVAEAWIYLKLSNGKVYQLKETTSYQQSCCEKKVFSCGGLQMYYVTPMRRWRIFYNGLLKETDETSDTPEKMVHVKFSLLWKATSEVFDFATDVCVDSLARSFAKTKFTKVLPAIDRLNKALNFYAQSGIVTGLISIEGIIEDHHTYLFGERIRFLGDTSIIRDADVFHMLGQVPKDGSYVHIIQASMADDIENLVFGFYVHPTGKMSIINNANVTLENSSKENNQKSYIKGQFHIEDETFVLKGSTAGNQECFKSKKSWNGSLIIDHCSFEMNSFKCEGFVIKGKISVPANNEVTSIPVYKSNSIGAYPLTVHFSDKSCQDSSVTGGKGSSLGKLTELSKNIKNFIVPNGLVVTTASYELFITKEVLTEIRNLEAVLYGNTTGDVKEYCEKVKEAIVNSEIPSIVQESIVTCLIRSFSDFKILKFAIRSSATGEDTEQMSAAGQMETYLGVTGVSEILQSVKKCWASQFSYIAVQYKKQNGQIINSPMAVVIQEMIPCDVAGVLFTCDPLTGNPTVMSITANYGLGESVVSASEEPDTIELKREFDDQLTVKSKSIGSKSHRIVLQDDKGTITEDVSEEEQQQCSLSDELALELGRLAVVIEKFYRSHRDIEWGFWNKKLYIFQSRPVTSGTEETIFEIEHELDGPLRVENDYFTMCNVGEVMPGAFSPLGLDVVLKYFRIAFHSQTRGGWMVDKPKYYPRGLISMYNHVMFYCCDLLERMDDNKDMNDASLVSLFGRIIEDEELFETAKIRFRKRKKSKLSSFMQLSVMFSRLFTSKGELEKTLKTYENYTIPVEKYKTSHEMFNALLYSCTDLTKAMVCHLTTTTSSSIWNIFIFNILKKARGEINSEVYRDFAMLLTTDSDVESADVPAAIEQLASVIGKEMASEDFKKMKTQEIIKWLESSDTAASKKYREFLYKHGHRCLKEFDIHSKTWGTDPTTLIPLLKSLVGVTTKNPAQKEQDYNKIISNLGLEFGFKDRLLLKFFIPRSRQGVQNREASKSLVIKASDTWRKGYYHLAKLMVSEGRIPDEDLLFFMTLDEIKELLDTRSPKVISKANQRRRHHPVMDKYIFPEIIKGFPKPINLEETVIVSSDEHFSMKGIPVSRGVTKAFVRVALNLEEAAKLQPGEILLTYSTDIGWSPYFPILAGVVTELGGLISHGAVVSREYGLPCIAGLHGATRQFQTGDYVLLDGNNGVLQRLPKPENNETE